MHHILSFSLFESERKTNLSWDSDYASIESNPLWIELKNRGFVNVSSPIMVKNKTLHIKNPESPWFYPDGVVLQKSGYIRDKGAKSGFVRNDLIVIDDMLSYLIGRYDKELNKKRDIRLSIEGSGITEDQFNLIDTSTTSKWAYDKSSGKINIEGKAHFLISTPAAAANFLALKFGKVKGDFVVEYSQTTDPKIYSNPDTITGSLPYAPDYVGGNFKISNGGLKNLKGIGKVKSLFIIGKNDYPNLSIADLENCKNLEIYNFFNIPYDTYHCLLVLKNGCLRRRYNAEGFIGLEKDERKSTQEHDIAKRIILTSPKLSFDEICRYLDGNLEEIPVLDGLAELKKKVYTKLGLPDDFSERIQRSKNRIL